MGDDLYDEQAEIIWGKTVNDIDNDTRKKGVVYDYITLNENDTLLLSAIDLDTLTNAIKSDAQLQNLIRRVIDAKNVTPKEELKIPGIEFSIYSPNKDTFQQIYSRIGRGVNAWGTRPYGYKNDKGIFVHLIGDNLTDAQTDIIWGKKQQELDKETQEKGVTYTLTTLNENKTLLISAVDLKQLVNEIDNNVQLKQAIIEFKREKKVIPSEQIHIPAPGEKIATETKDNNTVKIIMDKTLLNLDVPPQIINGRTLVPLRGIFEKFGAQVNWESSSQTIKANKENTMVELKIGKTTALINGVEKKLDVPAQIISGRTLVPLRFISESMGLKVNWDNAKQTVEISSSK